MSRSRSSITSAVFLAFAATPVLFAGPPAPVPSGLVSAWDGDLVESTVVLDRQGAQDLFGLTGFATTAGLVGDAFDFSSDTVALSTSGQTALGTTGAFTVEAWIKPAAGSPSYAGLVSELGSSYAEGQFVLRRAGDGAIQFFRRTGATSQVVLVETAAGVALDNTWTHVAAVFVGGVDLRIYVNGVWQSGVATFSAYNVTHTLRTTLGGATSNTFLYDGLLDEVALYRRALDGAEIAAIVAAGADGKSKAPAASPADLAAAWNADRACSGYAFDRAGQDVLKLGNSISSVGFPGAAFQFDGSDYATTGVRTLAATGPFTVEAWVNPNDVASSMGIAGELGTSNTAGEWYLLRLSNNVVSFARRTGNGTEVIRTNSTVDLEPNRWTHVAAVYAGGVDVRLYLNGQPVGGAPFTSNYTSSVEAVTVVGATDTAIYRFKGRIDDVVMVRRALSPTEVDQTFLAGISGMVDPADVDLGCLEGSLEDLALTATVHGAGGVTSPYADAPQQSAAPGDFVQVDLESPNGTFWFTPPLVLADLHLNGQGKPGDVDEVHIDLTGQAYILHNGLPNSGLGSQLLSPGGLSLAIQIPPGLVGATVRVQGFVISLAAANGFASYSNAIDIRMD